MKHQDASFYRCPLTGDALQLEITDATADRVVAGVFIAPNGNRYPVEGGVPDFTYPPVLGKSDAEARSYYDGNAAVYDQYLPLFAQTFNIDEEAERNRAIDALQLTPDSTVLEIGAGTGRDSALIQRRLGPNGRLFLQDLSHGIFARAVDRLRDASPQPACFISNASYLPLPDRMFDATYHFGGLNTFADIARALREAVRVTKVGGKVVMGDESMPPWLRDTEFGRVLMNSNPNYRHPVPLAQLPVEARNTRVRWFAGEVFFVIDFEVGEGLPYADLDLEIPGARGGTHRTRYYGNLEGVTAESKALAIKAAQDSGKSLHRWLSDVIKDAAGKNPGS